MAIRCEPTPMAMPQCSAASANRRLKAVPSGVPPVMDEIKIGADKTLPKRSKEVSTLLESNL